jgi:hypothetical protein
MSLRTGLSAFQRFSASPDWRILHSHNTTRFYFTSLLPNELNATGRGSFLTNVLFHHSSKDSALVQHVYSYRPHLDEAIWRGAMSCSNTWKWSKIAVITPYKKLTVFVFPYLLCNAEKSLMFVSTFNLRNYSADFERISCQGAHNKACNNVYVTVNTSGEGTTFHSLTIPLQAGSNTLCSNWGTHQAPKAQKDCKQ